MKIDDIREDLTEFIGFMSVYAKGLHQQGDKESAAALNSDVIAFIQAANGFVPDRLQVMYDLYVESKAAKEKDDTTTH